jgi:hypothetical protein
MVKEKCSLHGYGAKDRKIEGTGVLQFKGIAFKSTPTKI